jgi:hypothetical protein
MDATKQLIEAVKSHPELNAIIEKIVTDMKAEIDWEVTDDDLTQSLTDILDTETFNLYFFAEAFIK